MSVSDNNMSGRSHDPEQIDLIDLLVQLWRGKVTMDWPLYFHTLFIT